VTPNPAHADVINHIDGVIEPAAPFPAFAVRRSRRLPNEKRSGVGRFHCKTAQTWPARILRGASGTAPAAIKMLTQHGAGLS
jgi:hypothetical protein